MSFRVIVLICAVTLYFPAFALAEEMPATTEPVVDQAVEPAASGPVLANNTRCPVCSIEIQGPALGKFTVDYHGKVYNVCSPNDKDMFLAEYDRYGDIAENGPPSPYNEPPPEGFVKDYTPRPMPPLNAADVKKN